MPKAHRFYPLIQQTVLILINVLGRHISLQGIKQLFKLGALSGPSLTLLFPQILEIEGYFSVC